jgi:hypothetical protein
VQILTQNTALVVVREGFWEDEGGGGHAAEAAPLLRRNAAFICDPLASGVVKTAGAAGGEGAVCVWGGKKLEERMAVCRAAEEVEP